MTRTKSAVAVAGVAILATLVTGCSRNHNAAAPLTAGDTAPAISTTTTSPAPVVSSSQPTVQAPTVATPSTAIPTTVAATTSKAPAPTATAGAADLAAVTNDLAGIDAGTSATDKELAAGDSARAQNDDN